MGLTEDQIAHVADDPFPEGVYDARQKAVVRYAQRITRLDAVDDELYGELSRFFDAAALVELCLIVGSSNMVNRFHATFHTDVDEATVAAVEQSCPMPLPPRPPA